MIWLAVAAAAVGVDRTAFGQTMLAHPIIAATLGGWLAGNPGDGLWLGAVLTLISLAHVPVGETRLRDWSSVSLAGGFAVAGRTPPEAGAVLLLVVLAAIPAGSAIEAVRRLALRRRVSLDSALASGRLDGVAAAQAQGLLLHAVRGVVVTLLSAWLFGWAADQLSALDVRVSSGLERLWTLAALLGLPLLCRLHLAPRVLEIRRRS